MNKLLFAASAAASMLCATLPAHAQSLREEEAVMKVQLGDLNLRSKLGSERALRRIERASASFCMLDRGTRDLRQRSEASRCSAKMMYLTVAKLDAPMVTARYDARGLTPPILLAGR